MALYSPVHTLHLHSSILLNQRALIHWNIPKSFKMTDKGKDSSNWVSFTSCWQPPFVIFLTA